MKAAALVVMALLLAASAEAKPIAIAGAYGDDYGCAVFKRGLLVDDEPSDWLLVTPHKATGHEWSCTFQSSNGTRVVAVCYAEGSSGERQTISVVENVAAGTLSYTDMAGTFILHRCP